MIGRWSNTKEQQQGAVPAEVQQRTLHPNANPEPLLIALKYPEDEVAYGLNVDNERLAPADWRDKQKLLPVGTYSVKVHLKGNNVDKEFWFTLVNNGKGKDIELSIATNFPLIPGKEGSQTE